jgi:two-component system nitrogen regulation response regulator GlnG
MTAIQAAEAEAFDYLPKPFDLPDLMKRSARALALKRLPAEPAQPPRTPGDDLPLVGRTPAMQTLYRLVARVMNADLPVLITGESGTGKSLIARAIHGFSDRRGQPFVVVQAADLGGLDSISTLLARARTGSLVLDEVADFDAEAQGRLVRMLDMLGNQAPRIMATTQADLTARMEAGTFRADLYYRIGGITLAVPALRERIEDIPLLAEHVLAQSEKEIGVSRRIAPDAMAALRAHPWPGNVRQLENLLRRLMVTSTEPVITKAESEAALGQSTLPHKAKGVMEGEKLSASVARHLQRYFDLHGGQLPPPGVYDRVLHEIEVPMLEIALEATGGNQAKCADLLGINRNTLRKKITELDIRVTRRRKLM